MYSFQNLIYIYKTSFSPSLKIQTIPIYHSTDFANKPTHLNKTRTQLPLYISPSGIDRLALALRRRVIIITLSIYRRIYTRSLVNARPTRCCIFRETPALRQRAARDLKVSRESCALAAYTYTRAISRRIYICTRRWRDADWRRRRRTHRYSVTRRGGNLQARRGYFLESCDAWSWRFATSKGEKSRGSSSYIDKGKIEDRESASM